MDEPKDNAQASYSRRVEVDVDHGSAAGFGIGIGMFLVFQAMITGAFQLGVISGDTPLFGPLRFAGITQLIYICPTLLFFVNRGCPRMAKGFAIVAAVVLAGTIAALVL